MIASDMRRETSSYGCCVPEALRLQLSESPALTESTHPKTLQGQGWLLKAQTDCLWSRANLRMRQTPKMTHKRAWPMALSPSVVPVSLVLDVTQWIPATFTPCVIRAPFQLKALHLYKSQWKVHPCHACPNFIYICFLQHLSPGSFMLSEVNFI